MFKREGEGREVRVREEGGRVREEGGRGGGREARGAVRKKESAGGKGRGDER